MTSSNTWLRNTATGLAALALLSAAGCSSDEAADSSVPSAGSAAVMASTSIWADVVSNVACGEIEVAAVVPAGVDAHDFELGAKEADAIASADLLVVNGLGLEGGLSSAIESAGESGVTVVELGEVIEVPEPADEPAAGDSHADDGHNDDGHTDGDHADDSHSDDGHSDDGHDHGDEDPHLWLNPDLVIAAVEPIRAALSGVEDLGVSAEQLDACAADYIVELEALSEELEAEFASLTPQQRVLVTDHEALGHFADRFGFEVVGTVLPSTSSLGETNPRDLDDLVAVMKEHGVTTVFAGAGNTSDLEATLSGALGAPVTVRRLDVESLNPSDGADSYVTLMRTNAQQIAQA